MTLVGWTSLALFAGVALAAFFYLGLWLTIRHLRHSRHPALFVLFSFVVRTAAVLSAFLWLAGTGWQAALAAIAGFTLGRVFVLKSTAVSRVEDRCT